MNTYFDVSLAYDNDVHRDCIHREKGDHIYLKDKEYVVLRVQWAGSYDYSIEMCPIGLLERFVN